MTLPVENVFLFNKDEDTNHSTFETIDSATPCNQLLNGCNDNNATTLHWKVL